MLSALRPHLIAFLTGFISSCPLWLQCLNWHSPASRRECTRLHLGEQRAPGCHCREGRGHYRDHPVQPQSRVHFVPRFTRHLFVVSVSQAALAGFSPETSPLTLQARTGASADTAARAVATTVIIQFSLRVAFGANLESLVLSCGFSFASGARRFLARNLAAAEIGTEVQKPRVRARDRNAPCGMSCADWPPGFFP